MNSFTMRNSKPVLGMAGTGQTALNPLVKGGRLVSAANERGDFRPLRLECTTEHHGFAKASESASLFKIPPRDCVASAPFDKGVNHAAASSPRISARFQAGQPRECGHLL